MKATHISKLSPARCGVWVRASYMKATHISTLSPAAEPSFPTARNLRGESSLQGSGEAPAAPHDALPAMPLRRTDRQRGVLGYALLLSGFIACPCHAPLLLAVLGGTTIGSQLLDHTVTLVIAMGSYFLFSLFLGLRLVKRREQAVR